MARAELGPDHELAKRLSNLESAVAKLSTQDKLQNSSIGINGLTVTGGSIVITGGGSLVIQGTGTITVPGGLTSAGSITAATTLNSGSDANIGGNVNVTGAVIAPNNTLISTYARNHQVVTGYVSAWLDSSGNLLATASSERFKRDIQDYGGGDWRALRSIRYRLRAAWILADIRGDDLATVPYEIGILAEEALAAGYPELVVFDDKGKPWSFHYERLAVIAISAAQENDKEIAALRKENGEILARLEALESR